jgi:signal transduction histidine kinase
LDVEDSGIGISPEHQEHLFNRFYRVTNMPEEEVRGLGVGLYLASAIVEAHGGEILVESEEGVGSTFSVILPALADNAQGGKGIT